MKKMRLVNIFLLVALSLLFICAPDNATLAMNSVTVIREGKISAWLIPIIISSIIVIFCFRKLRLKKSSHVTIAVLGSIFLFMLIAQILVKPVARIVATFIPITLDTSPTLSIVTPTRGMTYVNGKIYPISWHFGMNNRYLYNEIVGEILLVRPRQETESTIRIAKLTEQKIFDGNYNYFVGPAVLKGPYHIHISVWANNPDCINERARERKCPPSFAITEATAPINFE